MARRGHGEGSIYLRSDGRWGCHRENCVMMMVAYDHVHGLILPFILVAKSIFTLGIQEMHAQSKRHF